MRKLTPEEFCQILNTAMADETPEEREEFMLENAAIEEAEWIMRHPEDFE